MVKDINSIIQKHFHIRNRYVSLTDVEAMLHIYSKYGMYYVIVPFVEEVRALCDKETVDMIDSIIHTLPHANFIQTTVANYHTKLLQSYELAGKKDIKSGKESWLFALIQSTKQINANVWESYDTTLLWDVADSFVKSVGLWTPGLFSDKIDSTFLVRLSTFTFAALDTEIRNYRANCDANSWLPDIISEQISILVEELSVHYYLSVSKAQYTFLQTELCEFRKLTGLELREHLFAQKKLLNPYFDYNEQWVQALEKLCEMAKSWFGSKRLPSVDTLLFHIPLLYQLINQDEKAENKLLFQLEKNRKLFSINSLMSCTIALAKSRNDILRMKISSYLEDVYSINRNNENVNEYLSLLGETIDFFSIYFDHIRSYICAQNTEFLMALRRIMKSNGNVVLQLSGIKSAIWIYDNLIKNDSFIKALSMCKEKIQAAANPLIDAEQYFARSLDLFYLTSSHMDSCPRIVANQLLDSLRQCKLTDGYYEVLYGTDFYDAARHQAIYDRFETVRKELPSREFSCWARDIIQEYCHGEAVITNELISACAKISNNPIDYLQLNEDSLNRQIRNLLEAALNHQGYSICDQTQQGLGNTGRQPGEVDILIKKAGLPIAIYEGLIHRGHDYLTRHIAKAINRYNYFGCRNIYIVDFMRNGIWENNWKAAMKTVSEYPRVEITEMNTGLNGIRKAEGTFQWEGRYTGKIVFIGVNCTLPQ